MEVASFRAPNARACSEVTLLQMSSAALFWLKSQSSRLIVKTVTPDPLKRKRTLWSYRCAP